MKAMALLLFEIYYAKKGLIAVNADFFKNKQEIEPLILNEQNESSEDQNRFGIKVISVAMGFVGIGIIVLGTISNQASKVVNIVGAVILFSALLIWRSISKAKTM